MMDYLFNLFSLALVGLVLFGLHRMSKVETAVSGNRLGALSMFLAAVLTLIRYGLLSRWVTVIWLGLAIGAFLGLRMAKKVLMIQMPQMVGLLNGLGGLASMLAGVLTPFNSSEMSPFTLLTSALAVLVGGMTFMGSLVAAGKLHKVLPQQPLVFPLHQLWTSLALTASLILMLVLTFTVSLPLYILLILTSNLFGYLFAIRVGGADMPITISLLNSFSGVAGAIAGMAVHDPLLVAVGGIVGSSGLLLTQIMCRAMNRSLMDILLSRAAKVSRPKTAGSAQTPDAANKMSETAATATEPSTVVQQVEATKADPLATALHEAQSVIIVPGYGMALAQAQQQVRQLADSLEQAGKSVEFAIHPVAGRMPGHMNVLLAEVDVPYEKLHEMDEINDSFAQTDLAIVIGANDVINPAANTAEGTPIYGMPVLDVAAAKHVIILNYDLKPGYAGVPNPLYAEAETANGHVQLLLGDAKEKLQELQKRL